jgi:hypothetical protein
LQNAAGAGDDPQNASEHAIESFIHSRLYPGPHPKSPDWVENEEFEILSHWPLLDDAILDKGAVQLGTSICLHGETDMTYECAIIFFFFLFLSILSLIAKQLSKKVRTAMVMKNVTFAAI